MGPSQGCKNSSLKILFTHVPFLNTSLLKMDRTRDALTMAYPTLLDLDLKEEGNVCPSLKNKVTVFHADLYSGKPSRSLHRDQDLDEQ